MKRALLAAVTFASLFVTSCGSSSSGDDSTVQAGSGQVLNPGGKPQSEADATRAAQMKMQGEQMNAQRATQTQAMQDAMKRTGGK